MNDPITLYCLRITLLESQKLYRIFFLFWGRGRITISGKVNANEEMKSPLSTLFINFQNVSRTFVNRVETKNFFDWIPCEWWPLTKTTLTDKRLHTYTAGDSIVNHVTHCSKIYRISWWPLKSEIVFFE